MFFYFEIYTIFVFYFESSGFARIGLMSTNTVVGAMMIVMGCLWSLIAIAAILLTIRVYGWLPLFN